MENDNKDVLSEGDEHEGEKEDEEDEENHGDDEGEDKRVKRYESPRMTSSAFLPALPCASIAPKSLTSRRMLSIRASGT